MPKSTPHQLEYAKKYREQNRVLIRQKSQNDYYSHRQKRIAQKKEYYEKKSSSPLGKKSITISSWKRIGIIDSDYSALYDAYLKETNCYICGNEFKNSKDKHLDHDHNTGEARYICCTKCNTHFLREENNIWK